MRVEGLMPNSGTPNPKRLLVQKVVWDGLVVHPKQTCSPGKCSCGVPGPLSGGLSLGVPAVQLGLMRVMEVSKNQHWVQHKMIGRGAYGFVQWSSYRVSASQIVAVGFGASVLREHRKVRQQGFRVGVWG